jgi:hypothetical protein
MTAPPESPALKNPSGSKPFSIAGPTVRSTGATGRDPANYPPTCNECLEILRTLSQEEKEQWPH